MSSVMLCGTPLDSTIWTDIATVSAENSVPPALVGGLVLVESDGVPTAVGGANIGLLQLNTAGGQGSGYTVAQLEDPVTNLRIGVPYIATAYQQYGLGGVLQGDYSTLWTLLQASGHPGVIANVSDPALRQSLTYAWTQASRPDLGGMTALNFIGCAVRESLAPGSPPPAYEYQQTPQPTPAPSGGGLLVAAAALATVGGIALGLSR